MAPRRAMRRPGGRPAVWFVTAIGAWHFGPALADATLARQTEQARMMAAEVTTQIRSEVAKEMAISGPVRSVMVCKFSSPEVTSAVSRRYGARITRVSLRPRNPALGMPDAWEQRALLEFERQAGKGAPVDKLEFSEVTTEPQGRFFRYARAIPVVAACMSCHGAAETLSPAVKATLAEQYPRDTALNYRNGEVRGAVSVKFLLP